MKMRYLTEEDVNALLKKPGGYILGVPSQNPNSGGDSVYVGRSENLKQRLNDYYTDNYDNDCIKGKNPERFWYDYTKTIYGAYKLECEWYHKYPHPCNSQHPEKDEDWWRCPICGV